MVEPYKSEILPHWRFKTRAIARTSAKAIYKLFLEYKKKEDFIGMDMSRKFLQMGYTRSRRYANHPSGKKYEENPQKAGSSKKEKVARKAVLPQTEDWATNEKAQSARIFYEMYIKAREDTEYKKQRQEWSKTRG